MRPRVYPLLRTLHLFTGLFLSPFVVIFALSAIYLVHAWIPGGTSPPTQRTVENLSLPPTLLTSKGRAQVRAARELLDALGVTGDIGYIREIPKESRLLINAALPGAAWDVDLNVTRRSAVITTRYTSVGDALIYLHKMPGPHNVATRGNTPFMAVWTWLADGTAYLLLFLTASGIYLWAVLRSERRVGTWFLAAGAASFAALILALIR